MTNHERIVSHDVLGRGRLAQAITAAVATAEADWPAERRPLVVATDGWDIARYPAVRAACLRGDRAWLPVRTEPGTAVIGPLERPGVPGCFTCAELRRRALRRPDPGRDAALAACAKALATEPSAWLTELAVDTVAALVADEVRRAGASNNTPSTTPRTDRALLIVDLANLDVHRHQFLPVPWCPDCGGLPDDIPQAAVFIPRSHPKPDSHTYRVGSPQLRALEQTYIDDDVGLVGTVERHALGGMSLARAPVGLRIPGLGEYGYGRSRDYTTSSVVAVLEALERYGGLCPGGKRTVVRAAFTEVADQAVNPQLFGLYPPDRYRIKEFAYQPFQPDEPLWWVWAHSFACGEPILVPECLAYYGVSRLRPKTPVLAADVSSGCALGSCLEEAALYAILEVAERDAAMLTWHTATPAPAIDLDSATNRAIPLLADTLAVRHGYRVLANDITLEQGVPAVWVTAVNQRDDDRPFACCATAARLDPQDAIHAALCELGGLLLEQLRRYPEERTRIPYLLEDPAAVRTLADHALQAADPRMFTRLAFLLEPKQTLSIGKSFAAHQPPIAHPDLREDLLTLVRRFLDSGLDVLVVNQTTPEHRTADLACARVLIPGTLPITFGHQNRRLHGLPRLYHVPHRLGRVNRPLEPDDIRQYPHPFS